MMHLEERSTWKILRSSNKADSAERTGKKRFEKILSYTNNIDLFDTLIESNKKYCINLS